MIRNLVLLFNLAAFLIYRIIFQDGGVEVKQKVPQTVKAGSEFTVELTINKGSISGFAKFQQELPAGMTASPLDVKNATFSFVDQNVKLIWMSLPNDKDFTVTYKVSVSNDMAGPTPLAGKFSYIDNNEKRSVNAEATTVDIDNPNKPAAAATNVTPAPTETTAPTTAETSAATTTPAVGNGPGGLTCTRNVATITNPDEFTVDVIIARGSVSGFAKLEEDIPAGFTASSVESANAVFSFVDQKAKFLWMALPSDNEIKVTYKVKRETSTEKNISLEGLFSFLENDVTQKVSVPAQNIALVPGAVASTAKTAQPTDTPATTQPAETTAVAQTPTPTPTETPTTTPTEKETTATTPTETPTTAATETKTETQPTPQQAAKESQPAAATGKVNYKVQIMAAHKPVSPEYFQTNHQITDQVSSEMHEGWHKFLIGSYGDYRQARDKREAVSANKLPGPFVTAYNGAKRITVQEALMISNQKWVK